MNWAKLLISWQQIHSTWLHSAWRWDLKLLLLHAFIWHLLGRNLKLVFHQMEEYVQSYRYQNFIFFSSEMVVVFGQRFDWRDAERKRSNIYQDIRGLSPSIDQMVDLSWPLVSPQDCLTLHMKEHPTRLREMKQQCDSQNANPRSDSKSRDPMKSGGVAKIESESRSSSYGSGVKRSGSETNRNDHDTNRPPESKRIKTEQPRPDVKSEFTDDKKWDLFFICLSSNHLL